MLFFLIINPVPRDEDEVGGWCDHKLEHQAAHLISIAKFLVAVKSNTSQ